LSVTGNTLLLVRRNTQPGQAGIED
jgi:hypothetical protein